MKSRPVPRLIALACVLLVIGGGSAAWSRRPPATPPGQFDYYLLSLSWSPAYCEDSPRAAECRGYRRYGFIVHGLWPQFERGWPEHCSDEVRVPEDVVQGMVDLMPARGLVIHEWQAHGSCSGLAPPEFFAAVRRARESVVIPRPLVGPTEAVQKPPAAVVRAFLDANPRLTGDEIVVTCSRQGLPRLREVHVCLNRDLAPRSCSAQALRAACRAPLLLIPPLR